MPFLGFVGFNAIAYCIYLLTAYKKWKHAKLQECVGLLLLFLSLPSFLAFGGIQQLYANRSYDKHKREIDCLKCICRAWCRPPTWDIERYGFECDPFTDKNGDFDIRAWREHELSKIG